MTYRRVSIASHASGDDEAAISVISIWLFAEVMRSQFPTIHRSENIDLSDLQRWLHWRSIHISVDVSRMILERRQCIPSSLNNESPVPRPMPAFAITMSHDLWGEFCTAASNILIWSSHSRISHFTNCALLYLLVSLLHSCLIM